MNTAKFDDVEIAYLDEGHGTPVLLIHGFASRASINWHHPGWIKTLVDAGYRVIAFDNRGHGDSSKFYDPARYEPDLMAGDAISLLDHLDIEQAHLIGYSMGSRLSAFVAMMQPQRVRSIVFGGMGDNLFKGVGRWQPIAEALEADDVDKIADPVGRKFRLFADQTGSDRLALAACIRPSRQKISAQQISKIQHPALVVVGTNDEIAGSGQVLADLLVNGQYLPLVDKDHMKAVGDKNFKAGVLEFYNSLSSGSSR